MSVKFDKWKPISDMYLWIIAKKKIQKLGGSTGATQRRFYEFPLLKVGFGAMLEVFPWASWRSNIGWEGIFISSHTQILEFCSQNHFFPLGSFKDAYVPERRILPQFPNKAFFSKVLKTKVALNDQNTCKEPSWRSWPSSPILYNSRKSIRTPVFLTKTTTLYNKV